MKIVLPHAAGLIFTGLRLGLAMGFIGIVIAEPPDHVTGIGDLVTWATSSVADHPEMFGGHRGVDRRARGERAYLRAPERRWLP